jgi:membrane protease YdiL (CAAX protease family)
MLIRFNGAAPLSVKIFCSLVLFMMFFAGVSVFIPPELIMKMPAYALAVPKLAVAVVGVLLVFALYGGLGAAGMKLSAKIGFPELWDAKIPVKTKLFVPAITGTAAGVLLIIADIVFVNRFALKPLPHPVFPVSIFISLNAGIGEEIIFRLFLISFLVWLFSNKIFKGRYAAPIFWTAVISTSLLFALGHLPALILSEGYKTTAEIPPPLIAEVILLNGLVSILCAAGFRKYGILFAMGVHFWTDAAFHVIYPLFLPA